MILEKRILSSQAPSQAYSKSKLQILYELSICYNSTRIAYEDSTQKPDVGPFNFFIARMKMGVECF